MYRSETTTSDKADDLRVILLGATLLSPIPMHIGGGFEITWLCVAGFVMMPLCFAGACACWIYSEFFQTKS